MKVRVDLNACLGYAICVGLAPEYYELDEDGLSHVIQENVDPEDEDRIRETVAVCPQLAIHLIED